MVVEVTNQDIEHAGHKAVDNPITQALQRATHQKWVIFDGYIAYQITPPYWSRRLPDLVRENWHTYQQTGRMQPFSFEFELEHTVVSSQPSTQNANPLPRASLYPLSIVSPTTPGSLATAPTPADPYSTAARGLAQIPSARTLFSGENRRHKDRRRDERRKRERRRGERRHSAMSQEGTG